jgi:signal transduction histidine kinase
VAEPEPSLKVSAHVLVQLGSELVTDVEQALLECVKNAYDADAPGCKIEIDTRETGEIVEMGTAGKLLRFSAPSESVGVAIYDKEGHRLDGATGGVVRSDVPVQRHLHYTGRVTVEDRGTGLSIESISGSWLVISGSVKRSVVRGPKQKTDKGRTPLGDKGLGRLGSMKLGDILEVESATGPDRQIASARFRWSDCTGAATVDQVPVFTNVEANEERFKGTRVTIKGLRDMPDWRRKGRVLEITKSLARLVSPFEATSTFPVSVTLDGDEQSLGSVTNEVLNRAVAKFTFKWTRDEDRKSVLMARAYFKKRLFTTGRSEKQDEKIKAVFGADEGKAYLQFLDEYSRTKAYQRRHEEEGEWFLVLERRYTWTHMLLDNGTVIADPGPFEGAFFFFNLDRRDQPDEKAAAGLGVGAQLIKDMAGISLLRDGFRVRSSGDWLGIAAGMTSGSFYHMRDNNTVGYFSLTGEHNYLLVEKSDREGFVDDAAYRGFHQIAATCRDFANDALENTRRAVDDLYKKILADQPSNAPPSAPLDAVAESIGATRKIQEQAEQASAKLASALTEIENAVAAGTSDMAASAALRVARDAVNSMQLLNSELARSPDGLQALRRAEQEKEDSKEQSMALYESAAVGLSARGLAHELRTHITEIRQKVTAILQLVKQGRASETAVTPHIKSVRASCTSISSAASLIDPMLPRARNLRDTFDLRGFIDEYLQARKPVFEREGVTVSVVGDAHTVRINRARLLQALDNLVRNSVYWLARGYLTREVKRPKEIRVELTPQGFSIADSGPGVDPHVEDSLFELFVTGKPAQDPGQGLGLFIIRELLEADGCDIELGPERNPEGRRFRFNVDLSAVLKQ